MLQGYMRLLFSEFVRNHGRTTGELCGGCGWDGCERPAVKRCCGTLTCPQLQLRHVIKAIAKQTVAGLTAMVKGKG